MRFEPTEIARLYGRSRVGVVVHKDLKAVYVNDAYAKMVGRRDVKDFMASPDMRQYIPPSFHYEAVKLVDTYQHSSGFHGWKKVYNLRVDGSPVWMEISDETVEWQDSSAVLTTAQMIDNGTTAMQVDHMLGRSFIGVMVHRNMTALYVNEAFARLMGAENASEFMANPNVLRFVPKRYQERATKHVAAILSGEIHGERHRVEDILDDGTSVWRDLTDERILWHDGKPAILTTAHDVREEVEMHDALVRAKAGLEEAVTEVIRMVPSAVAMLDNKLDVIHYNHEFSRLFGTNGNPEDASPSFEIAALRDCYAHLKENGHGHATIDEMDTPSGRLADVRMNMMEGGGVMISATDITDHKRKEEFLDTLASTDPLTRTLNRRGFESAVSRLREIRHLKDKSWVFGLIVLDLDFFKQTNDTYGHAIGDRVLEKVAEVLRQALRDDDLVVRLGGEEFAVLLPSATVAVTKRIAERLASLIRDVEVPVDKDGSTVAKVTASFGVTVGGEGRKKSIELAEAMRVADRAMYAAKQAGRNQIKFKMMDSEGAKPLSSRSS
ncbi:sensor domain-containing diguanylate cyclase [Thalassospira lucentensis]|uniref:sensor domain-containing diguanylate cyclase n=1 Tax=Thalassospira lucentensis TaxID=168935 RepID=UPI00142DDDCD|nr:diguanylate cyclase [Thalassospira lucentensis]NIZ02519.1 diguanylate cyclase [Thalassospira lucentensis]